MSPAQGEPLNNYAAVCAAVQQMTDPRLFALSRRHVTVSTVGVVPRLAQMAADLPGVSLALSLHAPTQELRQRIVPSARAYPLPKLMGALAAYQEQTQQRVFVEYVMLSGAALGCALCFRHDCCGHPACNPLRFIVTPIWGFALQCCCPASLLAAALAC